MRCLFPLGLSIQSLCFLELSVLGFSSFFASFVSDLVSDFCSDLVESDPSPVPEVPFLA
jgi:hypothetical protein